MTERALRIGDKVRIKTGAASTAYAFGTVTAFSAMNDPLTGRPLVRVERRGLDTSATLWFPDTELERVEK